MSHDSFIGWKRNIMKNTRFLTPENTSIYPIRKKGKIMLDLGNTGYKVINSCHPIKSISAPRLFENSPIKFRDRDQFQVMIQN